MGHDGAAVPYRQDKQSPAHAEARNLWNLGKLKMKPKIVRDNPLVVAHGDFRFAALVCSELTDISKRSYLRGKIDGLFVLEWNRDLNTFESLVNSAALDIHTFVAQVNHREYGDSRIRCPSAIDYKRDIVQVRGGLHDHVLVGELDYHSLRKHQSANIVDRGKFKPLPAGFEIDRDRRMLPDM